MAPLEQTANRRGQEKHPASLSRRPCKVATLPFLARLWTFFLLVLRHLVKLLHDMNLPMWVAFVAAVILLSPLRLLLALVLLFAPPKNDPHQISNRFGVDPRYASSGGTETPLIEA